MGGTTDNTATVLVVEDEAQLAALYRTWLEDTYTVQVAHDGREGLELLADHDVDVILLDRRMPEMSGDEMLERARNRGIDCPVIMVTAVEPEMDLLWLDFDDYLEKPVTRDRLRESVRHQLKRTTYQEPIQEYLQLFEKYRTLTENVPEDELEDHDEYRALVERLEELRPRVEEIREELDDEEFVELGLRDVWLDG